MNLVNLESVVKGYGHRVLLDGVSGKPRPEAEVARLGELAKRAVGFDAQRGDELDISSAPFVRAVAMTCAPCRASALAMARPIPLEAPVTSATLLSNRGRGESSFTAPSGHQ